jgi:ABC-type multidrug transport system ATPase subunit
MTNRLEFDSIEFAFGQKSLLTSVYMVCETGKLTGLLGRNGCGKSTLMKIVFGAIPSAQKSVRINGQALGLNYLAKNHISYLPQGSLIPDYLTLRGALGLFRIPEREVTELFPEVSEMMHLRPSLLSGGYRRIVEIMMILNSQAPFCLLDEPFTGLTPVYIEKIKDLISAIKSRKGIIISDHMYRHVTDLADRLYLLTNGQTYQVSDHKELVSRGYLSDLTSP